jgi:hypothetical protein
MSFKVRANHKRAFAKSVNATMETVPVYSEEDYDIEYTVDDNTGDILEEKILKDGAKPTGVTTVSRTGGNEPVVTRAPSAPRSHAHLSMRKVCAESFM